ncbi:hypothetical protein [Arsenophonus endosymbiont of Bemisia tabaci]|uniref:hypothetical protein n=1 Tax=Arsenophonus endosymbiont of Bemisia tabaci TaxID=536059 RepID=UPI0015F54C73|nr:hypothetical protein [Arsenophonus endosymbiont of Bemisia tabaci]CAA2929596.1 hypothetical protein ARSQ2_00697 [Arsenophonus endosymbiont of Bemisia tabaci Q2]
MRHRYFVRTQYGVIKIKSLSYNDLGYGAAIMMKKRPIARLLVLFNQCLSN